MASLGYGLELGRFLPLAVFFSFSSFCFSGYIVHLRCTSEGGSLVSVCCPAVLLSLLSGLYRVHGLRVSSLCHAARWHFLPPLSFQKVFVVVVVVLFSLSSLPPYVFRFCLWLIGQFVTAVSLPDQGSHFEFLFSSAFVYIPILCHRYPD